MTVSLRQNVIAPLIALEEALEVDVTVPDVDETHYTVVKAWPFFAPEENTRLDAPCFMHTYEPGTVQWLPNGGRRQPGTIHIRMFVGESDPDAHKWSEVAMAFHEEITARLQERMKLGEQGVMLANLRASGEFPVRFGWPGEDTGRSLGYVGLHYLIDVTLNDKPPYGAGA